MVGGERSPGGLSPNTGGSNSEMQNGKRNPSRWSCEKGEGRRKEEEKRGEGKEVDRRDDLNLYKCRNKEVTWIRKV